MADVATAAGSEPGPHRRFNPLTRSWITVSPHRAKRPWLGQNEAISSDASPQYDPKCYLCPGNTRASAQPTQNPQYDAVYTFTNDFPALLPETAGDTSSPAAAAADPAIASVLLRSEAIRGTCKVICFSPRHDLTIAEMDTDGVVKVVEEWTRVYEEFKAVPYVRHVQIFENKGAVMGCSNPHPHGQVWATESIPEEARKELDSLLAFRRSPPAAAAASTSGAPCLLCAYAALESSPSSPRLIFSNATFVAVVPYWAVWPFETLVLPRVHLRSLSDLDAAQRRDLADAVRRVACRYDNLFRTSFPYSMGVHQAPVKPSDDAGDEEAEAAHLHLHFYPPLLRSATVKKFMVGFEMMAEPQRDLTPEQAADRLRALSEVHYKTAA
ncbi:galactose-1-phosphate uridylyltransferase [Zopfochytrium polystomum]|nr:galactose-1-phosphate uridylyltransferase [Zopfochytrium polystomum]